MLITRIAELKITVEDNPDPEAIRLPISNLLEYNNDHQLDKNEYQPMAIWLRDPNSTIIAMSTTGCDAPADARSSLRDAQGTLTLRDR